MFKIIEALKQLNVKSGEKWFTVYTAANPIKKLACMVNKQYVRRFSELTGIEFNTIRLVRHKPALYELPEVKIADWPEFTLINERYRGAVIAQVNGYLDGLNPETDQTEIQMLKDILSTITASEFYRMYKNGKLVQKLASFTE